MSIGKLPSENTLPEFVCCLPSLGATIQPMVHGVEQTGFHR